MVINCISVLFTLPCIKSNYILYLPYSDSPNYSEIHEILTRFMDYPHNSSEVKAMELLTAVLANITCSDARQPSM